MMVKVLVYAYATGVFSSRKVERRLHERIWRSGCWRRATSAPPHHLRLPGVPPQGYPDLFVQVVKLAREMGLVKLGTVAIDGTKVKANASRHKAMSYERMKRAEVRLSEIVPCWRRARRPPTS